MLRQQQLNQGTEQAPRTAARAGEPGAAAQGTKAPWQQPVCDNTQHLAEVTRCHAATEGSRSCSRRAQRAVPPAVSSSLGQ